MRSDSGEPEVSWGESICQGTAPPLFMEKSREIPIEATLQAQRNTFHSYSFTHLLIHHLVSVIDC